MSRTCAGWLTMVLGTLLASSVVLTAAPEEGVLTAVKCAKAAKVDGVAGKDEYPAPAVSLKQTPDREAISGAPASARVAHDGKTLFVTITVPVDDASKLSKGESWSSDDAAEVCLRDASGTKPGPTFVIHGFMSGKHECTTDAGATAEQTTKLEKAVKFAAKVDAKSWTGEWAIPFEAAGLKYKPGLKLDFNMGVWRSESGEWIIWRGAQGPTFELDNGGKLTLE